MRYILLLYSKDMEAARSPEERERTMNTHWDVIDETRKLGILQAAQPLHPPSTATTVRTQDGKTLVTDGPFAETKEQLAGYYILDCENLDEAISWAAKIRADCSNAGIEIRPLRELPSRPQPAHEPATSAKG